VLLVNSLQSGKAWQEFAQQTEKSLSHTNSAVSRQVYIHALLVHHLYSIFWYGATSETGWEQRSQKNLFNTDFTELKKITSRSYSNFSNYSVFQVEQISLLFVFFHKKQFTVN